MRKYILLSVFFILMLSGLCVYSAEDTPFNYMGTKKLYQIVIDRSAEMLTYGEGKLDTARLASAELINTLNEGKVAVGIMSFSWSADLELPITEINSLKDKTAVIDAVRKINEKVPMINAAPPTAVNRALSDAAQRLTLKDRFGNNEKTVFLITDSKSLSSIRIDNLFSAYKDKGIPLFIFACKGGDYPKRLARAVQDTGGDLYSVPASLGRMTDALIQASRKFEPASLVRKGTRILKPAAEQIDEFPLDSMADSLIVNLNHNGRWDDVKFMLVSPNMIRYDNWDISVSDSETLFMMTLNSNVIPGKWKLYISSHADNTAVVSYNIEAMGRPEDITYSMRHKDLSSMRPGS